MGLEEHRGVQVYKSPWWWKEKKYIVRTRSRIKEKYIRVGSAGPDFVPSVAPSHSPSNSSIYPCRLSCYLAVLNPFLRCRLHLRCFHCRCRFLYHDHRQSRLLPLHLPELHFPIDCCFCCWAYWCSLQVLYDDLSCSYWHCCCYEATEAVRERLPDRLYFRFLSSWSRVVKAVHSSQILHSSLDLEAQEGQGVQEVFRRSD